MLAFVKQIVHTLYPHPYFVSLITIQKHAFLQPPPWPPHTPLPTHQLPATTATAPDKQTTVASDSFPACGKTREIDIREYAPRFFFAQEE